ncbi:hypothetical protein GQ457_10G022900 [Hibiscus cannabinus]
MGIDILKCFYKNSRLTFSSLSFKFPTDEEIKPGEFSFTAIGIAEASPLFSCYLRRRSASIGVKFVHTSK